MVKLKSAQESKAKSNNYLWIYSATWRDRRLSVLVSSSKVIKTGGMHFFQGVHFWGLLSRILIFGKWKVLIFYLAWWRMRALTRKRKDYSKTSTAQISHYQISWCSSFVSHVISRRIDKKKWRHPQNCCSEMHCGIVNITQKPERNQREIRKKYFLRNICSRILNVLTVSP